MFFLCNFFFTSVNFVFCFLLRVNKVTLITSSVLPSFVLFFSYSISNFSLFFFPFSFRNCLIYRFLFPFFPRWSRGSHSVRNKCYMPHSFIYFTCFMILAWRASYVFLFPVSLFHPFCTSLFLADRFPYFFLYAYYCFLFSLSLSLSLQMIKSDKPTDILFLSLIILAMSYQLPHFPHSHLIHYIPPVQCSSDSPVSCILLSCVPSSNLLLLTCVSSFSFPIITLFAN